MEGESGFRKDGALHTFDNERENEENVLVKYDCISGQFTYLSPLNVQFAADFDARPLWQIMVEEGFASENTAEQFHHKISEIAAADTPQAQFAEYFFKNAGQTWRWYRVGFVCAVPGETIHITFTDIESEIDAERRMTQKAEYDELTGLLSSGGFDQAVEAMLKKDEDGVAAGEYAIVYFDVLHFKAINDMFGMSEGDRALRFIADAIAQSVNKGDLVCRMDSDKFVVCTHTAGEELEELIERIVSIISGYDIPFQIICNAGIYVINDDGMLVRSMIDRAVLAQSSIKGSYTVKYNYYTEELRKDLLSEQEIVGFMNTALAEKQFLVYYQPQYNHSTGSLVGAEALVRWQHPERGMISPGVFIPIFEKNGFITKLDFYVFEQTCIFLRKCMDKGLPLVPISTNFSRNDIFQQDFVEQLEEIRTKYNVPVNKLRVEITESAIMGSDKQANEVIKKLHQHCYVVEMDDFGSGYSSLNVLKDIDLDIIKLDMMFLSEESDNNRGGIILSSIVRMAKWLGMPVIAEGVETVSQADFLRSIGCNYIQGYLYSKPLPGEAYEKLLGGSTVGVETPEWSLIETMDAGNFWNPDSLETLIFNNYVGGAAIFEYCDGKIEILRVNKKYLQEIGMNLTEKDFVESDPLTVFDEENKKIFLDMFARAIDTAEEQESETWRNFSSSCCGKDRICIRSNVRMIGRSENHYLFYAMIRNVTAEKNRYSAFLDRERRFQVASEQADIYYWEYTIATHEMRPCFRCMRDLGLPALMTNYPDSAIEMGVFPPEVADMYRDWHRQLAAGVPQLEAVIPLTVGRVPFRVKYTTEFDANGRPVKAYGSAVLIVREEEAQQDGRGGEKQEKE